MKSITGSIRTISAPSLVFLVCFALLLACAMVQAQAQPPAKPTPTPTPSPVTVVNTDTQPVPVKVVSSADTLGVLVDVDPSGGYVDTRQYRRVAILGMRAGGNYNGSVQVAFVDNAESPTARTFVGACSIDSTNTWLADGFQCTGPLGLADGFTVSGPFLELRQGYNLAILKVYLQK